MKKIFLLSLMTMLTMSTFARKHVSENAIVVADTIFYAEDMSSVASKSEASYYRILMSQDIKGKKQDVFQDFYLNGTLKAEGGYSYIDLGNDKNSVLDGDYTTYYPNGKEKWHGTFKNGKRDGYFTMQMRDGSIAAAEFDEGESTKDFFIVTRTDGTMQKHSISDLKTLL